ncbi:hypothetical protein GPECTOR_3g240 [Gonium pectorale]|uniref:Uncharacterized protein n=1 Tax=Gonium pectorale TaxID=33097 RepID=A0A150GZ54_GONPE|nr:hypothetical protein GPECTOR_3g240 [Gonium pectorale]|eukprot:KXZ55085.1 hypothetical protein GPECTOR_3g240 [Gonium pectorale]
MDGSQYYAFRLDPRVAPDPSASALRPPLSALVIRLDYNRAVSCYAIGNESVVRPGAAGQAFAAGAWFRPDVDPHDSGRAPVRLPLRALIGISLYGESVELTLSLRGLVAQLEALRASPPPPDAPWGAPPASGAAGRQAATQWFGSHIPANFIATVPTASGHSAPRSIAAAAAARAVPRRASSADAHGSATPSAADARASDASSITAGGVAAAAVNSRRAAGSRFAGTSTLAAVPGARNAASVAGSGSGSTGPGNTVTGASQTCVTDSRPTAACPAISGFDTACTTIHRAASPIASAVAVAPATPSGSAAIADAAIVGAAFAGHIAVTSAVASPQTNLRNNAAASDATTSIYVTPGAAALTASGASFRDVVTSNASATTSSFAAACATATSTAAACAAAVFRSQANGRATSATRSGTSISAAHPCAEPAPAKCASQATLPVSNPVTAPFYFAVASLVVTVLAALHGATAPIPIHPTAIRAADSNFTVT